MPRQLPWLNNGGGSRTQVKQPPKATIPSEVDDDFFDGTALASSSKGKGKARRTEDDSNNDFPDLSAEPSTSRTKSRTNNKSRSRRAPSSSPPAVADHEPPQVEDMRKGVSKFDLRDDEWMMVEDEFLETAKLFTRHLHIAEYEKLKERIEAKKKEQVQGARPVVAGGKMSTEGAIKKKAEVQEKCQRKALLDVFASQDDEDADDQPSTFVARPTPPSPTLLKRPPIPSTTYDPDDDDLDFSNPVFKRPSRTAPSKPTTSSASQPPSTSNSGTQSASPATPTPPFAKPAPKSRATTSRKSRATPFDMLDEYVPRANRPPAVPAVKAPTYSSPAKPSLVQRKSPSPIKPQIKEEWGSGLSKETTERIAKRKAEREKERDGKKKKHVGLDDIPTFLV